MWQLLKKGNINVILGENISINILGFDEITIAGECAAYQWIRYMWMMIYEWAAIKYKSDSNSIWFNSPENILVLIELA